MLVPVARWGLLSLLIIVVSAYNKPAGRDNDILTCRPGAKFLRDCGNECVCQKDGKGADCTSRECPQDFQTSKRDQVTHIFSTMERLRKESNGPVFTCVPRSYRKINRFGGTCFCTSNGKAEICSEQPSSPWAS